MTPESPLHLETLAAADLALALALVAVRGYRSMEDLKDRLSQELYGWLWLTLALFQGPGVGWIEIRCLMLGIRGIASVGCISGRPFDLFVSCGLHIYGL